MNASEYIQRLLHQMQEGEVDPIVGLYELMDIKEELESALKQARETAFEEISKHPEKEFEYQGRKISKRNAAGRWNFEPCAALSEIEAEKKKLTELLKAGYKSGSPEILWKDEMVPVPTYMEGASTFAITKIKS